MKIVADMAKRVAGIVKAAIDPDNPPAGVFVSRPVLNAKKWHDWAVKWGVPSPVDPADMHVTVVYAKDVEVKVPLVETAVNVSTQRGAFAHFGQEEDCLVFTFACWELWDRNWDLQDAGAVSSWPTYRPHMTLSYAAGAYEIPDEALQDVPAMIVLGPETIRNTPAPDPSDVVDDDDSAVVFEMIAMSAAADLLKAEGETMPVLAAYDLAQVAKGRATKGVAKRLAEADWAPEALKAKADPKTTEVRKRVERDYSISVRSLSEEITKNIKHGDVAKADDDQQMIIGIASVSTVNGELVKDLHGDEITTQALVEFNRSLISGSRAGKFEHEGEAVTEVVGGLVLTQDLQKALGIDLGFEPYLVEIHVPDPVLWAEVKQGDWDLSIAGTMWCWETEAGG